MPRASWAGVISTFGRPVGGRGCVVVDAIKTDSALGTPVMVGSFFDDGVAVGAGKVGVTGASDVFPHAAKKSAAVQRLNCHKLTCIKILWVNRTQASLKLVHVR